MNKLYFICRQDGYYTFFLKHYVIPDNVVIIPNWLPHPQGLVKKIIHKLFVRFLPLKTPISNKQIGFGILRFLYPQFPFRQLSKANAADSVLIFDIANPNTLRMLRNVLSQEVFLYDHLQNPIKNCAPKLNNQRIIDTLKKQGILLSTFDRADAEKYGISFREQFYCHIPKEERENRTDYDFFFCGLSKDRKKDILNLLAHLRDLGYSLKVIMPESESSKEYISNDEYIYMLKRCKCVIDINQKMQVGLSRRPLEALFFHKKLITNNSEILKYDFYRPNNIFCINHDSIDDFQSWFSSPLEDIPEDIVHKYTIDKRLQEFIECDTRQ